MVQQPRIVIVGAGFGGMQTAQSLTDCGADVLLIDRNNYHTFIPLLYQVAAAQIEPETIAYPIRNVVRGRSNLEVLVGEVTHIDFNQQVVETHGTLISYDYLVLATGSYTQFPPTIAPSNTVFSLKTLEEAIALRNHLFQCLEVATHEPDPMRRQRLLTVIIVGGGPTGVEVAGTLVELSQALRHDYPALASDALRIRLIQSGERLLPNLPAELGGYTLKKLRRMGVDVKLNTRVQNIIGDRLQLEDGATYAAATILWTAGQQATPPDTAQDVDAAPKNKVTVRATLQLVDYPNVYAIGDVAYVQSNPELVGVAPEALQQGVAVGRNIRRQLRGKAPRPFQYFNKGRLAIIGDRAGVGKIGPFNLKGWLPWLMWLIVHWVYLPGFRNRVLLLLSWTHAYLWGDRAVRLIVSVQRSHAQPVQPTSSYYLGDHHL